MVVVHYFIISIFVGVLKFLYKKMNINKTRAGGTGVVAQTVKSLPCKQGDLSLDPQDQHKSQVWGEVPKTPLLGRWTQTDLGAYWSASLSKQGLVRT